MVKEPPPPDVRFQQELSEVAGALRSGYLLFPWGYLLDCTRGHGTLAYVHRKAAMTAVMTVGVRNVIRHIT